MMNIKAHGSEQNYGIDRISSLPDDVCTHILSFLSTREAVQTCILSKRWINTWASAPDLKFDIEEFGLPKKFNAVEFVTKFDLLVKSVLEKRETFCVNRFQLWLDSKVYWPRTQVVTNYIGHVMKLEPRECSVKLCSWEKLKLNTDLISTCASLIYLQLQFSINEQLLAIEPNSVNLPCLKTLNLNGFTMSDDFLKKLLLGCPVLEELVLESFYIDIIEICSHTLKKLVLRSYFYVMRLQISTPNLMYLDIKVICKGEVMLLNMSSLVDASIYIDGLYDQDKYVTRVPKLIHSLSNVESLQLDLHPKLRKVLKKDISDYPVFNNIKHLTLLNYRSLYDFDLAPFFLLHSPKLQELTLDISIVIMVLKLGIGIGYLTVESESAVSARIS